MTADGDLAHGALASTVAGGSWRDRSEVLVLRAMAAVALLVGAVWWSGTSQWYKRFAPDEGGAFSTLGPWTITVIVTLVTSLAAIAVGPRSTRARAAWAAVIGTSVFVANRHNLYWATAVTCVAIWAIVSATMLSSDD
jgi:hypothetical protein